MATKGDVFTSPDGGKLVFRQTTSDTNGELLEVEVTYGPHSNLPPAHYHPHQEETFTILKGTMTTRISRVERVYEVGETFVVPKDTPHRMHNAGDEEAQFRWQVRPALNTEAFFETIWTLAKMEKNGLVQMAVVLQAHREEIRLASQAQQLVLAVLAPIGRLLGYRPRYEGQRG